MRGKHRRHAGCNHPNEYVYWQVVEVDGQLEHRWVCHQCSVVLPPPQLASVSQ